LNGPTHAARMRVVDPRPRRSSVPPTSRAATFCGRAFTPDEISMIQEVAETCSGLTRTELANTVCDLLEWERPNGRLKARECREFLDRLEAEGLLRLKEKQPGKPVGTRTRVPVTERGDPQEEIQGSVRDVAPVTLRLVETEQDRLLWRELVGRYHYLGHKMPFGAHLRYLVGVASPREAVAGCLQFSSPAWTMAARDRWIGWDDPTRRRNLQQVVQNSRFLLLPWVKVRNLASAVLAMAARQLPKDWKERYAVEPVLLETLVDPARYAGTCYKAANWVYLGVTTGRGRMDRKHERDGAEPKDCYVYPLVRDATERLSGG
jgi:hypothetical protein